MQYSAKLSPISDAGGEDAAWIDIGGILATDTDRSATYSVPMPQVVDVEVMWSTLMVLGVLYEWCVDQRICISDLQ